MKEVTYIIGFEHRHTVVYFKCKKFLSNPDTVALEKPKEFELHGDIYMLILFNKYNWYSISLCEFNQL